MKVFLVALSHLNRSLALSIVQDRDILIMPTISSEIAFPSIIPVLVKYFIDMMISAEIRTSRCFRNLLVLDPVDVAVGWAQKV